MVTREGRGWIEEAERRLRAKRGAGVRCTGLFADRRDGLEPEEIARGFCLMERAEEAGDFADITRETY